MVWNFEEGNFDSFHYALLNAPWASCYINRDVNSTVINWMSLFVDCAEQIFPHLEITTRLRDKPFMDSDLHRLMRSRDRLNCKFRKSQSAIDEGNYKRAFNQVVSKIRLAKRKSCHKS